MRSMSFATALLTTAVTVASVVVGFVSDAHAGCRFGEKNLSGYLAPGQGTNSRSFTVDGSAMFIIEVVSGGPVVSGMCNGVYLNDTVHACRKFGNGEIFVDIQNNNSTPVRYRWKCRH